MTPENAPGMVIASGDIFESGCRSIVNPVNTEGVMGAGLAKEFKSRWPEMFQHYRQACDNRSFTVGMILPYLVDNEGRSLWILNFPTKANWIDPSKDEYITSGLAALRKTVLDLKLKSIAIPALGCGLGGLSWPLVRAKVQLFSDSLPHMHIKLFEPKPAGGRKTY